MSSNGPIKSDQLVDGLKGNFNHGPIHLTDDLLEKNLIMLLCWLNIKEAYLESWDCANTHQMSLRSYTLHLWRI